MVRAEPLYLIKERPEAHGIFEDPVETEHMVYCVERSAGQTEKYQAQAVGLDPELKLIIAHSFEYNNEKICRYKGIRYRIIRPYINENDGIELTVQRVDGNAAEVSAGV